MFVRSTNEIFKMLYEKMQQERRDGGRPGAARQSSAAGTRQSSDQRSATSAGPQRQARPTCTSD